MPIPLIPPPLTDTGAITYPRTLQKWLDINPISKLTRTQGYITIPEFSVNVTNWNGASDIVASFNYEGPSNFSLSSTNTEIPLQPNYLMCISWRDGDGNIFRYALWKGVGEVILFNLPLYTGQVIYQNFRIEIWSVSNQAIASQSNILTLYTSVLGKVDYRWGTDFALVNPDAICTDFEITISPVQGLLPQLTPSGGAVFGGWIRADTGIIGENWSIKSVGAGYFSGSFTSSSNIATTIESVLKNNLAVTGVLPLACIITNTIAANDIWCMIQYNGDGVILDLFNESTLTITNGVLSIDGTSIGNTPLNLGQWYIIEWWYTSGLGQCNIWPLNTALNNKNYTSNINVNTRAGAILLAIGSVEVGSASIVITDLFVYSQTLQPSDQLINLNYFADRYESILTNPLVTPIGSYSVINQPIFTILNKNNTLVPPSQVVFASSGGGVQGVG
jgi:hypothetical protein